MSFSSLKTQEGILAERPPAPNQSSSGNEPGHGLEDDLFSIIKKLTDKVVQIQDALEIKQNLQMELLELDELAVGFQAEQERESHEFRVMEWVVQLERECQLLRSFVDHIEEMLKGV